MRQILDETGVFNLLIQMLTLLNYLSPDAFSIQFSVYHSLLKAEITDTVFYLLLISTKKDM